VSVGDELTVEIVSLADGPDALARVGDYVLFVAGALPGEKVRIRVVSATKKFGRGALLEIERRSPDRVGPRCEHFLDCGGCHFQHLAYPAQLDHKTRRLEKALEFGMKRRSLPILPMIGPEDPWGQRNKTALHVKGRPGAAIAGLHQMHSRDVVPIRECPVQDSFGTRLAFAARDEINRERIEPWGSRDDRGLLRAIVVRATTGGEASVTLVSRRPALPRIDRIAAALERAGATTVALNVNDRPEPALIGRDTRLVAGKKRIAETVEGVRYLSSPAAFFQTSPWGAAYLVHAMRRLVDPPEGATVIDLYSGGGLLSLALADRAQVIGIEENPAAVEDANASARENGMEERVGFHAGVAERLLHDVAREVRRPWAVMLDPPREGARPAVLDAIVRMQPSRIVYVSCDPVTLGRDLGVLARAGWQPTVIEPLDMFPHAYHVESVTLLERG
jgi:23S rRNA (uracil1939-C5)-methyltransferase